MDQLIFASLSRTHYWYEVDMLKVPAIYVFMYVCMYSHTYSKSMNQPGKIANPARGQLNRENEYFPVPVLVKESEKRKIKNRSTAAANCQLKGGK